MRFLNASVLPRKALNHNLSWGFPLGNLLPKTRVLKHRVLERKRRPNANASVSGTQRFRTLSSGGALHGVATLKVRKGALSLWMTGLEHLQKWSKHIAPSGAAPQKLYVSSDAQSVGPATTQNLVVKFDVEICGGVFPSKRSSNISFQTSPELRHQFRRKLRQLHSGNRWCLKVLVVKVPIRHVPWQRS